MRLRFPALLLLLLVAAPSCGSDSTPEPSGGAIGAVCTAEKRCAANAFCDEQYNWCGHTGSGYYAGQGVCASRDSACVAGMPVCGCDGKVYADACAAYRAGTDVGAMDAGKEYCAHALTPEGRFACGPWYCDPTVSYCQFSAGDQGDRWFDCSPLPAACGGTATCDCADGIGTCSAVDGNGVTGIVFAHYLI